jgi:hypothetical protein
MPADLGVRGPVRRRPGSSGGDLRDLRVLAPPMEELSMILLTVPLFFPMATGLATTRSGSASSS